MVHNQGIEVYLAPFSDITKRYKEYPVPATSPSFTGDHNEVYIEGVDGERFVIVVDLGEDFHAKGSTHVKICYQVDESAGASKFRHECLTTTASTESKSKGHYIIEDYERRTNGNWVKSGYTFVPLQIDENLDMSHDQVVQSVKNHGKVVVDIRRSKLVERPSASTSWTRNDHVSNTRVTSRAVVEEHHVSHAVGHIPLGPSSERFKSAMKAQRIESKYGDPITFTIRYRSLDALKKLEIVPKDKEYIDLTAVEATQPLIKLEHDVVSTLAASATQSSSDQRNKKRQALEEELEDIELQRRERRVKEELARLEEEETEWTLLEGA